MKEKTQKISGRKRRKITNCIAKKGEIHSFSCKFIIPFVEKKFPKDVENSVENVKKPLGIPLFRIYPDVEKSAFIRC